MFFNSKHLHVNSHRKYRNVKKLEQHLYLYVHYSSNEHTWTLENTRSIKKGESGVIPEFKWAPRSSITNTFHKDEKKLNTYQPKNRRRRPEPTPASLLCTAYNVSYLSRTVKDSGKRTCVYGICSVKNKIENEKNLSDCTSFRKESRIMKCLSVFSSGLS
jgi:hypothetical protein